MTCRTYTKKETVLHALYIALLTACGGFAAYSSVFCAAHIGCTDDRIALGFTVFFAVLILSVDFFECRAMGARLFMNEEGLGIRRFGKIKVFIRWGDIRDVGTGYIPTPYGRKRRIFFCDRLLSEEEHSDLITMKYHTVHFSRIPKEWYGEICRRLPGALAGRIGQDDIR